MANNYFSWTVALPAADIPAEFPRDGELPDNVSDAMARPDAISTSSRRNWLHWMLGKAIDTLGGSILCFLVVDPESLVDVPPFKPDVAGGGPYWASYFAKTSLPSSDLEPAIEAVNAWLEIAATEPQRFADLVGDGYDADSIIQCLECVDLREEGSFREDGDVAEYLIGFLKALRNLMLDARTRGLSLVHIQYVTFLREPGAPGITPCVI
jgi:hypothetical protein